MPQNKTLKAINQTRNSIGCFWDCERFDIRYPGNRIVTEMRFSRFRKAAISAPELAIPPLCCTFIPQYNRNSRESPRLFISLS